MSSDRFLPRIGLVSGLAMLTLLAGCQVRPLYSTAGGTGEQLASVGFSAPKSRVEQVVRNNLVFLASGGAGESRTPVYDVKLDAISTASAITDDVNNEDTLSLSGSPVPGRVVVTVAYTLTRMSDQKLLKAGKRDVVAQMDVSRQGFAKLRAIRDGENRAAREAAEFVRAEIAIALAKEPPLQPAPVQTGQRQTTVWQK